MTKFYKSLICLLGIGAMFAGCQKVEELVDEIDYTRVLTPLKFDSEVVPATGTDVVLTWQKMKNADGYELEVYEQTDDSKEVSTDNTGILVDTYILGAEEVPFTVYGLEVDKSFYARVRGTSETLQPSHWAYLETTFSTSAVRASLNPRVTARTSGSVSLSWDNASDKEDLTSVLVEVVIGEGESLTVPVTAEERSAAAKTVEGLDPAREYRFTLLFGKAGKRGSVTAFTRPVLDGVNTVWSAGEIYAAINNQAGEVKLQLAYSDNEVDMTDGGYPDTSVKLVNVTGDVYLYGASTEEGKKPVISSLVFSLQEGAGTLHVEDLVLDGKGTGFPVENPKADMKAVEFINCEITGYEKGLYSSNAAGANVASFLVDGCYVHDINAAGTGGGDFIDARNGVNGSFVVRNSTFYACARTFFRLSDNAKVESVLAENCTFNLVTATNTSSNNAGIFNVRAVTGATSVKAVKCVFLNELSDGEDQNDVSKCFVRLCRNSNDTYRVVSEGNVYYNVGAAFFVSSAVAAESDARGDASFEDVSLYEGVMLDSDPCVNSVAGKLYLAGTAGEQIRSRKAGDPRWWDAVQPVIVREKELTVVGDEHTWDFTEKTVYDTEELLETTIIGNARIYATTTVPAKVVMSKGIDFSATASVSPAGVPTYSAVEVLVSGYGSVKVLADSEDGLGAIQVLVAGDRYPVLADGVEHTVNLGDLTGENSIYVLANNALTLKHITWTKDLTPDPTVEVLDAPKVTVSPNKLDKGTEQDIVVSWGAVANAEDYVLTFQGVESILATTEYAIPAAEVAALAVGEYTVTVKARPVSTSSKYAESEVGEAAFKINQPVVSGGEKTLVWDFSTPEWQAALEAAAPGAKGTNQADWTVTLDGFTYTSGASNGKWDPSGFIQPNGGGSLTARVFSFTAPAGGTLRVTAQSANSSETRNVAVVDATGAEQLQGVLEQSVLEFDVEAGEVYIYPKGGIRFYKFEFTYTEAGGSAGVHYTWDFASAEWQAEFAKYGAANTDIENWDLTYDGLTLYSKAKSKYNTTFFQWGGKGSASDRYARFEAPSAGTLIVTASNTGGSEDMSRMVTVNQGGSETSQPGGVASGSTAVLEFDVEAGEVLIYCTGNALRFYKIEFVSEGGGSGPAPVDYVWDFAGADWQAEFGKFGAANTDIENWDLTYDGLTLYSKAKSKYNTTYFQWGGKGSTSDRYARFEAPSAGTLIVTASNTGGSEDMSRMVTVNQGGSETSQPGGVASGSTAVLEFDVEAGEVFIYCTGNALRFYSVEYHSN